MVDKKTKKDVLDLFKSIQQLDKQLITLFKLALKTFTTENALGVSPHITNKSNNFSLSGSSIEGAIVPRAFQPTLSKSGIYKDFEVYDIIDVNKNIEFDLEMNIVNIPKQYKHLIKNIPGKPGFLKVKYDKILLKLIKESGYDFSSDDHTVFLSSINAYVPSNKLKDLIMKKVLVGLGLVKYYVAIILGIDAVDITMSKPKQKTTKSSIENNVEFYINGDLIVSSSWDIVFTIRVEWCPDVLTEWLNRKRKWPEHQVIAELSQYSYIVAKPTAEEKHNPSSTQMRYSFSHIERVLISKQSSQQQLIYLISKCIFYKWLKPFDEDHIESFFLKSIMLFICEEHPPNDKLWNTDTDSTIIALQYLYKRFLDCLEKTYLPYYFIPSINVFEELEKHPKVLEQMIQQIHAILQDITEFIPISEINNVMQFYQWFCITMDKIVELANALQNKDFSIIIRYPNLIKQLKKAVEIMKTGETRQHKLGVIRQIEQCIEIIELYQSETPEQ